MYEQPWLGCCDKEKLRHSMPYRRLEERPRIPLHATPELQSSSVGVRVYKDTERSAACKVLQLVAAQKQRSPPQDVNRRRRLSDSISDIIVLWYLESAARRSSQYNAVKTDKEVFLLAILTWICRSDHTLMKHIQN